MRTLHGSSACAGVMDSIKSTLGKVRKEKEERREERAFQAQMKYLTDSERAIDANVYLETMQDLKEAAGLSGFREHLPWVQNNPILDDMKREELILRALTVADRRKPRSVKISDKKRVARAVDADLSEIETLLERVCGMRDVQKWMLGKKKSKAYLPQSSEELQRMISAPNSGFKRTRMHRNRFPSPGVKTRKNARQW